jgi:hypothetical protein
MLATKIVISDDAKVRQEEEYLRLEDRHRPAGVVVRHRELEGDFALGIHLGVLQAR